MPQVKLEWERDVGVAGAGSRAGVGSCCLMGALCLPSQLRKELTWPLLHQNTWVRSQKKRVAGGSLCTKSQDTCLHSCHGWTKWSPEAGDSWPESWPWHDPDLGLLPLPRRVFRGPGGPWEECRLSRWQFLSLGILTTGPVIRSPDFQLYSRGLPCAGWFLRQALTQSFAASISAVRWGRDSLSPLLGAWSRYWFWTHTVLRGSLQ